MPAWGMHLTIAKKVNKKLKLENNEWYVGNLLPDIYSGWIIENASKKLIYDISHYGKNILINEHEYMVPDYEEFINKNDVKENVLLLGYLSHLLSDYFFNHYAFELKYIKNEKDEVIAYRNKTYAIVSANKDMARVAKQNDFKIYSEDLIIKNKFKKLKITESIIKKAKEIKNVEVEESDLEKFENYVEVMVKGKDMEKLNENSLEMFSKSELDNMINMCVDFILVVFKENSLI